MDRLLLNQGADPQASDRDLGGWASLVAFAERDLGMVQVLLEHGCANANTRLGDNTPLYGASQQEHLEVADLCKEIRRRNLHYIK
jgi:hypothetical protein